MPKRQLITFNKTILPFTSSASLNEHLVSHSRSQEVILESFFFLHCHIQSITKFFEFFSLNMFTITPTSTLPTLLSYFRPSSKACNLYIIIIICTIYNSFISSCFSSGHVVPSPSDNHTTMVTCVMGFIFLIHKSYHITTIFKFFNGSLSLQIT